MNTGLAERKKGTEMKQRVCPVWMGYLLVSPLRKLFMGPEKILGPFVRPGMKVLDIGCAMGFFSIPAAKMLGPRGESDMR